MNKGLSYFISFAVVTSDGVCIEPDESKTITCPVGTKITVQTRDISPGCNGGLSYFTYVFPTIYTPDEYAIVRAGLYTLFAKAVLTTPEATSYVHEYYVNVCGVLPSVDKNDTIYDDAIDFFLQEDLGDDARPFRTHPLKEEVPLVLKSGTQFKVYARTLVYGSEAHLSRFEYNKQQRSIGKCTVADGQHQLMVHGYRRLAAACGDVIYTKRAFTIIGQPRELPVPVKKCAENMEEGLVNVIFRAVDSSDALLDTFPVAPATGCVEIPENTRFTVCVNEPGYAVSSFIYHGKTYKANSSLIATVPELSDTVRQTPITVRVWCASGWSVVNKHFIIRPVKNNNETNADVEEDNATDAKGSRNAAYYGLGFTLVTSSGGCHKLFEEEPVTLPSGTVFEVHATASAPQDVASINDYKYEGPFQSHMCTAVDGKKTLTVHAQRKHDGGWCQHYEATFIIIGEPEDTKASPRQYAVGLLGDTRNPVGNNWLISQGWELTLFEGDKFYVQSTVPGEIGRDLESFEYAGESHLQSSVVRLGRHVVTCGYKSQIEFTIVGQHSPLKAGKTLLLSEENSTKMADTKEGSSYSLFVETCDDDPVCYPVGDDGRVEVPVGTRFRFVATSNVEGRKAKVHCFAYCDEEMLSRTLCAKARVTSFTQVSSVTVIEVRTSDRRVVKHGTTDVTIIPIFNDRSGAAAPVADVEVTPPLGKDVERKRDGVMSLATAKETHETTPAVQEGSSPEYDLFVGLCDIAPTPHKAVKDGRIEVPAGTHIRFAARSNLEGYYAHVQSFKYQGRGMRSRAHCESAKVVDYAQTATVHVILTKKTDSSVTKRKSTTIAIIPVVEATSSLGKDVEYDGLILAPEPVKKTHVVPLCADAEGVHGKRFIPPWSDKERACEECFLTRVVDPRGWKATTGSGACNYTPMRVWLENVDGTPFSVNDEGDHLVPYGTEVVAKTDRGEISRISAGGAYHHTHVPFVFEPHECLYWKVTIGVSFHGAQRGTEFNFCLRTTETEEEIRVILEGKRLQQAIRSTTESLNYERESLEKTWERIQAAQDKITELKVKQAKLESK